eukprot:CAMPEP_0116553444 /NCGR_PEP_ID=MMETSP0397-20121206/7056_1 /TAXON_ID=216820 /ORGANISM="Cyclophora tenuis, Strain ECT3854" /LENGTH=416 /DNA_ID=CAMNT_0004078527 /DNA_START=155 /DNA_END=1405 /DNA_ORIENTATION=-
MAFIPRLSRINKMMMPWKRAEIHTNNKQHSPFVAVEKTKELSALVRPPGMPPTIDLSIPDQFGIFGMMKKSLDDVEGLDEAVEGMAAILLINPQQVKDLVLWGGLRRRKDGWDGLLSWKGVKRGSDLFIKGLGKFNIMETYQQVRKKKRAEFRMSLREALDIEDRKGMDLEMEFGRASKDRQQVAMRHATENLSWFASVGELRAQAYFGGSLQNDNEETFHALQYLLGCPADNPMRQHLLRHYHKWCEAEQIGRVVTLAKNARLLQDEERYCWYDDSASDAPPQKLVDELIAMEENEEYYGMVLKFAHLDKLPDKGRIRVLRSRREVRQAARDLNNCALDCIWNVSNREMILLVMDKEGKPGKPEAMASICIRDDALEDRFDSILLSNNHHQSQGITDEFNEYMPVLKDWYKNGAT